MKVAPVHLLSAVLRQHILPQKSAETQDKVVAAVLAELNLASTAAEKLAILERLVLRDQKPVSDLGVGADFRLLAEEGTPRAYRMSAKSSETLSEMKPQQFSRQWEAEAVIRMIMEHAQQSQPGDPIAGVALPFKPSASDIARAIEGLGYSPRSLFREEIRGFDFNVADKNSERGSMRALVLVCLTAVFVVLFFAF